MDSPARDQAASVSDVQGSPFFNYLCSLSPIKQVKTVHVVQTYSELTFPSAPTVFVSPQLGPQKASRRVQESDKEYRRNIFLELDSNQSYLQNARIAAQKLESQQQAGYVDVENRPPSPGKAGLEQPVSSAYTSTSTAFSEQVRSLRSQQGSQAANVMQTALQDRKVLDATQRGFRRCLDFQASDSEGQAAVDPSCSEGSLEPVPAVSCSSAIVEEQETMVFSATQESSNLELVLPSSDCSPAEPLALHTPVEEAGGSRTLEEMQSPFSLEMLQQSDGTGEMSESPESPKRRKSKSNSKDGCKRCKCKKSKCLKLYCECFSAGVYCVGSCTCRDCFNNLDHAETVIEARQQIEIRNPLAFAPKVIQTSPGDCEENSKTPASARHKRGCKCKKSMCLKKYCECYQVGVGCSQGCRCEGCRNVFGKKEAGEAEEIDFSKLDPADKEFLENQSGGKALSKNLSPITPYLEKPWQAKPGGKKRRPVDQLGSPLPSSVAACHKQSKKKSSSLCPPLADGLTKLAASPRWDGLDDICTLTPLPSHPTRPTCPSSAATSESSAAIAAAGVEDATPSFRLPFPVVPMSPFCSPLELGGMGKDEAEFSETTPPGFRKLLLQDDA